MDTSSHHGNGLSLTAKSWNPYYIGAGIGILSWLVFLIVDKPIGMSTEVSKFSGWVTSLFVGMEKVTDNAYWASKTPKFGYSTVFLLATGVGAFLSSMLGKTFKIETVPTVWREQIGASPVGRMIGAFLGGAILLYGARMAGGCTSGHGISGTLQLAVSGWLFFVVLFASGIATAKIMFRK